RGTGIIPSANSEPHLVHSTGNSGQLPGCAPVSLGGANEGTRPLRETLRLQSLNALGNVAIIDVGAVHASEMAEGRRLVLGAFARRPEFVVNGQARFGIESRDAQRLFIPADGGFRNSLIEEALGQPGIGLNRLG